MAEPEKKTPYGRIANKLFLIAAVSLLLLFLDFFLFTKFKLPENRITGIVMAYAMAIFYFLIAAGILGGLIFRIIEQVALRKYSRAGFFGFLLLVLLFIAAAAILPSNKAFVNWAQSRHKQNEMPSQSQGK